MSQPLVVIKGFAPAGLVQILRETQWTDGETCGEKWKNFEPIKLGDYCLATPSDRFAPVLLCITVIESGSSAFTVTGFCFPDAVMQARLGVSILGNKLQPKDVGNMAEYNVEISTAVAN